MSYVKRADIEVAAELAALIEDEILLGITPDAFWTGYSALLKELVPQNRALLAKRQSLQAEIDAWYQSRKGTTIDPEAAMAHLREIGYLQEAPQPFDIKVQNVDPEIATTAGPQLVVPVMNARFALNAANARWGSLYDALYGTDAIEGSPTSAAYDAERGAKVVAWARAHLDAVAPLAQGSWADVQKISAQETLTLTLSSGTTTLANPQHYAGYRANGDLLLRVNGLLIEIKIDPNSPIGASDPAGISDVRLESALTAIQDCEDSVAAVDAEDKCVVYANWLGLMRGDLTERFEKNGTTLTRQLNSDISYLSPEGKEQVHPGRALMLVRNVGHLMTNNAILWNGEETPEGIMDAVITVACAMHDLAKTTGLRNSRRGSVYVVKPKMHGPEEAAFSNRLYGRVEDMLGLPRDTVKLGIMDEERRTSANLAACIEAVKTRCVFINTGFLDRTGDEIHTMMQAGPVIPRGEMAASAWLGAYENGNVDTGLAAGLKGQAQIGKGMWARPDDMADMLQAKITHPQAGANTAWVPSPTAATLHATHYHKVAVSDVQNSLLTRKPAALKDLLTPPVMFGRNLSQADVTRELENACQSILGYVVRWVDQGIGCSKVPDIDDVALMEDRATLRISAQYLANWITHGICTTEQVEAAFRRMAPKVDAQNAHDPAYRRMAPSFDGEAFKAAQALVLEGVSQPSGYTEPLLYQARLRVKQMARR